MNNSGDEMKDQNVDSLKMFSHLDRLQRRIMTEDSYLTKEEFLSESLEEQVKYYQWMCKQVGELCDLI